MIDLPDDSTRTLAGKGNKPEWRELSVVEQCESFGSTPLTDKKDLRNARARRDRLKTRVSKTLLGKDGPLQKRLIALCNEIKNGENSLPDTLLTDWFRSLNAQESVPLIKPRWKPKTTPKAFFEMLEEGKSREDISRTLEEPTSMISAYYLRIPLQQQCDHFQTFTEHSPAYFVSTTRQRLWASCRRDAKASGDSYSANGSGPLEYGKDCGS